MLDEPLTGLDAGAARQVKDMLAERARAGAAVILTLEVAEKIADRIGIIAEGRLIAEGDLDHLRSLSAVSISPVLVAIAAQLAAALAFLAASSEEAGELVATAPVSAGEVLRRKLEAVVAPVALFLALPLLALAWAGAFVGAVALVFGLAAAGSTAALNFWKPPRRPDQNPCAEQAGEPGRARVVAVLRHRRASLPASLRSGAAAGAALVLLWLNAPKALRAAPRPA